MTAISRAGPRTGPIDGDSAARADDGGMVTVETAVALCAFVTVLAMVLACLSMVLDQLRCVDAAREAARLVARGERDHAADAVARIAPDGATFTVRSLGEGIEVSVTDPAAGGLLPGVHIGADAYAVPEPDVDPDGESGDGPADGAPGQPGSVTESSSNDGSGSGPRPAPMIARRPTEGVAR